MQLATSACVCCGYTQSHSCIQDCIQYKLKGFMSGILEWYIFIVELNVFYHNNAHIRAPCDRNSRRESEKDVKITLQLGIEKLLDYESLLTPSNAPNIAVVRILGRDERKRYSDRPESKPTPLSYISLEALAELRYEL